MYEYCDAVRDDYRRGSLAITSELRKDPDAAAKQPLLSKPLVRQLDLVDAPDEVKDLAIRHYYRAYAQRGRWAREISDLDEDIQGYEQTLKDEWEPEFVALKVRAPADPEARTEGLKFAMTFGLHTRARLRGVDQVVLCRGTVHGLADRLAIGWHPDYRDLMAVDGEIATNAVPLPGGRPAQRDALYNPPFVALILAQAAAEHERRAGDGLPFALAFLAAPIILHGPTRQALPKQARSKMALGYNSQCSGLGSDGARSASSPPSVVVSASAYAADRSPSRMPF